MKNSCKKMSGNWRYDCFCWNCERIYHLHGHHHLYLLSGFCL